MQWVPMTNTYYLMGILLSNILLDNNRVFLMEDSQLGNSRPYSKFSIRSITGSVRGWVLISLVPLGLFSIFLFGSGASHSTKVNPNTKTQKHSQKPKIDPHAQLASYWTDAKMEVDKSVMDLLTQHQSELNRGIVYHKFMHGDTAKKQIAITFDDGPHPQYTPKLLAILKQYNVKATFFLVGELAAQHPYLVKAEIAAGHEVGNHTFHHVNLTKIPPSYIATEIQACGDVIKKITGKRPELFRPPGGDYNDNVARVAEAENYTMILWTDDPGDYAKPGSNVIMSRTLDKLTNGGIILIHDGIQQTIDILPELIKYLKSHGYEIVTIDDMMGRRHGPSIRSLVNK